MAPCTTQSRFGMAIAMAPLCPQNSVQLLESQCVYLVKELTWTFDVDHVTQNSNCSDLRNLPQMST